MRVRGGQWRERGGVQGREEESRRRRGRGRGERGGIERNLTLRRAISFISVVFPIPLGPTRP